ncbi:hypothetical protein NPIL_480301 [Nephila pilipes]|uniref:SOCS box domain-containing protein n=1 Tax=Nephila pilipes TaxID=299642 RepID=A0A8X6U2M5_NEPPI|nr:hypothetical protein NPIL_480301 [Nephila pilipes]
MDSDALSKPYREGLVTKERFYLHIQFFRIYFYCRFSSARISMQLIWRAIPDAFITLRELTEAYGSMMSTQELRSLTEFFSDAMGEETIISQPRTLKHLSRVRVRCVMEGNGTLSPETLNKLFVPRDIRSYLRLLE